MPGPPRKEGKIHNLIRYFDGLSGKVGDDDDEGGPEDEVESVDGSNSGAASTATSLESEEEERRRLQEGADFPLTPNGIRERISFLDSYEKRNRERRRQEEEDFKGGLLRRADAVRRAPRRSRQEEVRREQETLKRQSAVASLREKFEGRAAATLDRSVSTDLGGDSEVRRSNNTLGRSVSVGATSPRKEVPKNIVIIEKKQVVAAKEPQTPSSTMRGRAKVSVASGMRKIESLKANFEDRVASVGRQESRQSAVDGQQQSTTRSPKVILQDPRWRRRKGQQQQQQQLPVQRRQKKKSVASSSNKNNRAWLEKLDNWQKRILELTTTAAPGPAVGAVAAAVSAIERATREG